MQSSTFRIKSGTVTMAKFFPGSSAELNYNNILKLKTDIDGITVTGKITLGGDAYDSSWNSLLEAPTKNAVYDKIESLDQTKAETAIATTSNTEHDFTGIPSSTTKIEIMLAGASLSGADELVVRLGDSGGFETSGYVSTSTGSNIVGDAMIITRASAASSTIGGIATLLKIDGNTWVMSSTLTNGTDTIIAGGFKTLSGTLTQIRLISSGSDTFDAGTFNIRHS